MIESITIALCRRVERAGELAADLRKRIVRAQLDRNLRRDLSAILEKRK